MTTETLQNAMHTKPFVPFVLKLADGRALRVGHPDFIAHSPGSRIAVVIDEPDAPEYVELLQVVSLELTAAQGAAD